MSLIHEEIQMVPTEVNLTVAIGTKKEVRKFLKKKFGKNKGYWKERVDGHSCVFQHGVNIVMVLDNEGGEVDMQDIVHECVHVTWFLSDMVDLKIDSESQETQAYYVDYLFGRVMDLSKK